MRRSRRLILFLFVLVLGFVEAGESQSPNGSEGATVGSDVIVGDISTVRYWGASGGDVAFSLGTISCNIGDEQVRWIYNSTFHPVLAQNLYRIKDGRIEQLGQSWVRHAFVALAQNFCGSCQSSGTGNLLGIGCSDTSSPGSNGSHTLLGPKSEVNASTGVFSWPHSSLPQSGTLDGRLRVKNSNLDPSQNPGARFFVEAHLVHPDDSDDGNDLNNASYREVVANSVGGGNWGLNTIGGVPTVREQPAIFAWQAVHPDVDLYYVDIPNDGRLIVGVRTIQVGKDFHTEVAIQNLSSHRSVRSLEVDFGSGSITNVGFHDVDYQFELYSSADWSSVIGNGQIEWSTEEFATNQDANALRWGTTYSFWCDSEQCPAKLTMGMFRPGGVSEVSIDICQSTVIPETLTITRGAHSTGGVGELAEGDDVDLIIRRAQSDIQARTEFEVKSVSPFASPSALEVTLEGAVFSRSPITQSIELYDYRANAWEMVDARIARRFSDSIVTVSASGDVSRFVETGTRCMEARIRYQSDVARSNFSSNTDQFIWTIRE